MNRIARLLCVGLTPADLERVRGSLNRSEGALDLRLIDSLEGLRKELSPPSGEAILAEYSSHSGGGPDALRVRNELSPRLPFIFLADSLDTEAVIGAVKAGASDIFLWSHHRKLRDVLAQALRESRQAGPTRRDDVARLATVAFRSSNDQLILFGVGAGGRYEVELVNPAFVRAAKTQGVSLSEADWEGKTLRELISLVYPLSRNLFEVTQQRFLDAAVAGEAHTYEVAVEKESQRTHQEHVITPVFDSSHRCRHLLLAIRDISDRKAVEAASRDSDARLREANLALLNLAHSRNFHGDNLIEALREITEVGSKAVNVARCSVWLYNSLRSKIRCIDLYDSRTGQHTEGMELFYGDHPSYFLSMEAQRVIAADDAMQDVRTREYRTRYLEPLGITSMLDAAVRLRGELVGVICLEHVATPRRWTTEEELFAAALADVVSLALEASERQRVEVELRESQQKLRSHFQHTPLAVIEFNPKFEITAWNPAAETIFGYPAHEALGRPGHIIIPAEAQEQTAVVWKQLLQGRGGQRSSNRNLRKDGRIIECDWYNCPLFDDEGQVIGVASLALDVTERLRAERVLRESEERFALAFQNGPIPQGIARLADRRYIAVNHAFSRLTGIAAEDAVGKTLQEMEFTTTPDLREQMYEHLARGLSQPPVEMEIRNKNGLELIGLVSAQLIRSNGAPCVLWSFENLTELRRVQAELQALKARG